MQDNTPVISNGKLFALLGFICAAIMASVFVYHMSNKQKMDMAATDNSVVFPVGRDIKDIQLVKTDGSAFTMRDLQKHWTLMFFGFTHCNSVCPVNMDLMKRTYKNLHNAIPNLQVVLVSLDPERDSKVTLKEYTNSYHKDFIGISGKTNEIRKLQSQLGIYSAKETGEQADVNYQIQHTSSIMLINPNGKWVGIFKYGMKPTDFTSEVKNRVTSLSHA